MFTFRFMEQWTQSISLNSTCKICWKKMTKGVLEIITSMLVCKNSLSPVIMLSVWHWLSLLLVTGSKIEWQIILVFYCLCFLGGWEHEITATVLFSVLAWSIIYVSPNVFSTYFLFLSFFCITTCCVTSLRHLGMVTVLAVKNGGGTWILSDGDSVTDNTDANDNDTSPIYTTSGAFDNFLFNKQGF